MAGTIVTSLPLAPLKIRTQNMLETRRLDA
jgi:hypothetical protein